MPSRERPSEALDADHGDAPRESTEPDADQPPSPTAAEAPASIAQAEAEAARAEAHAKAARAGAIRLRRQAEEARGHPPDSEATDADHSHGEAGEVALDKPPARSVRLRRRWLRRPARKAVPVGAAITVICASLGASGYLVWHHRSVLQERQRAAEFTAAAQQGVVTLMSIDFNKAKEDVQRVIDSSTGKFKDDYQSSADDLTKALEQSKVVTNVTVNAVAMESMTHNSGVVLVAATSEATNANGAQQRPAKWRLSLTLTRDGGQLKMSKVEFV
jgi:Mce-associated membrane protein